jgi:predicted O-methyltransferase YrrM
VKLFESYAYGHVDAIGAPVVAALWQRQPTWAVASISERDAAFFTGLAMEVRPSKVVEIGVASGWGSCVLLSALDVAGRSDAELHGVDIASRFFYDEAYATGQCVAEVLPECVTRYRLRTGVTIGECAPAIGGGIDFAFIDAHHMHPWATLDLLAILPFLVPGSWVAMHDLNLSRKEDQEHRNRGPKYLFEAWEDDRLHSTEIPTMAGAIRVPAQPASTLPLLLDIVHTPFETAIDARAGDAVCTIIDNAYGADWAGKFRRAIEIGTYQLSKMQSADIDDLRRQLAALRGKPARWLRRMLTVRGNT